MEEVRKLLDNGWRVLLFVDGLGQYSALAHRCHESAEVAFRKWLNSHVPESLPTDRIPFHGPNGRCGCGMTVEGALRAVTEKVLFGRVPDPAAIQESEGP